MSEDLAWEAYLQNDSARAIELFTREIDKDATDADLYFGLIRSLILAKDIKRAEVLFNNFKRLKGHDGTDARLLEAELASVTGQRVKSSQILMALLKEEPDDSLALALLAEQRLRLGNWDDGVMYFAKAINEGDYEGFARQHVLNVANALILAVKGGKVSQGDAITFFNRLSYATPQEMTPIWQRVIKAIKSGQPLVQKPTRPASAPKQQQTTVPSPAVSSSQAPKRQASAPARRLAQRSQAQSLNKPKKRPMNRYSNDGSAARVRSEFLDSIQQERALNKALQSQILDVPEALWPSHQEERIDSVVLEVKEHYIAQIESREDTFHVTDGNIFTELYFERCRDAMLRHLPDQSLNPILPSTGGVTRLELNLIEHLPKELEIMKDDLEVMKEMTLEPLVAAVGSFLGQVLCIEYEGVWEYKEDPIKSCVNIGELKLEPLVFAQQWLESVSKSGKTIRLGHLISVAKDEADLDNAVTRYTFIDPTRELADRALLLALANQWSLYNLTLIRKPYSEIASDMSVREKREDFILVDIDTRWCPSHKLGKRSVWEGRATLLFLRGTGEWLPTWHVATCEYALSRLCPDANKEQDTQVIIKLMTQGLRQHVRVIKDAASIRALPSSQRSDAHTPTWTMIESGEELSFCSVNEKGNVVQWKVRHMPELTQRWSIWFSE